MTVVMAIDPGPSESAYVVYDTDTAKLTSWAKRPNTSLRGVVACSRANELVIEMIASYGMPVGAEVFETCVWIGRFTECWGRFVGQHSQPDRLKRKDVVTHLCGSARGKDANVRQALIDRFGPGKDVAIGRKANPGPLYGLAGDGWAALAVAVTWADLRP